MTLEANGLLIGDCGLEVMEINVMHAAELGYDFRSDHWNQGYATEAATIVRDYAFDVLELLHLISLIRVHFPEFQYKEQSNGFESNR